MKAVLVLLLFVPLVAHGGLLPQLDILNKLLDGIKHEVDIITAEVEKTIQEIVKDIKHLDPAVIKDLENIVDNIVGLSNAGIDIASGVLALCQPIPAIPTAVFDFIRAGFAIFQDVSHIIGDVIDILQRINKEQGDNKQIDQMLAKMGQSAATFKNLEDQMQALMNKPHFGKR